MANKYVDKIHKLLTENKVIVIIIIVLGVVGTLNAFWPHEDIIDNSNNGIIIENSTLTESPIFHKSSNISVTYNSPPESDMYSPFYSKEISLNIDSLINGKKYHRYLMKFILPDDQEVLLEKVLFNTTYKIASCNEEFTDCYIYNKYRNKGELVEKDICWIYNTRMGHDEIETDSLVAGKRLSQDPKSCSKLVSEN
ncbi:MAG: hypothetical protein KAI26_03960 [Nanoarchaeota archaeon]|nr:hypothetical protein [Nanoarchaeota archaeon]